VTASQYPGHTEIYFHAVPVVLMQMLRDSLSFDFRIRHSLWHKSPLPLDILKSMSPLVHIRTSADTLLSLNLRLNIFST